MFGKIDMFTTIHVIAGRVVPVVVRAGRMVCVGGVLLLAVATMAATGEEPDGLGETSGSGEMSGSGETSLTIYSSVQPGAVPADLYRPSPDSGNRYHPQRVPGYAIIKQVRPVELVDGRSTIRFSDVAAFIEPTTVAFESLTDPDGTHVLEQDFKFDLVSSSRLMERFLDREITLWQTVGDRVEAIRGTLLSTSGGVTLRSEDGTIRVVNGYSRVDYPELPGGLMTRPTLVWDIETGKPGIHSTRTTYETKGITWWADYNVVFAEGAHANAGVLDLGAWVSIVNKSGATYEDARLKLIAGDVHRAPQPAAMGGSIMAFSADRMRKAGAAGFQEKSFFEYHLYTLGRPTTIVDNSTKQLELFPTSRGVPCEKVMLYYGAPMPYYRAHGSPMTDRNFGTSSNKKVDVYLRFRNAEEVGLGIPFPSGRIRVSKLDPEDGSLEFIGEDVIDHTPKNEVVLIKMGSAFDVVGERKQTDFKVDSRAHWMRESFEIKIRNHKEESVKVLIKENLFRWGNWEITRKTHEFEKVDSRTVHFPVEVAADGEVTVHYTVKYTW